MEGNECYKFATIRNYIDLTQSAPVRVVIDVGAHVGTVTRMIKAYFPDARVHAYEMVPEYKALAEANTRDLPGVTVLHSAVTGEHLFHDDLGEQPREDPVAVRVLKGIPAAGAGWEGGSIAVPADSPTIAHGSPAGYMLTGDAIDARPLDVIVSHVLKRTRKKQIDILKMDCEGCEHSALGTASHDTLISIRFIVGEYHGIERFYRVMVRKLYQTHKVNLIGQRDLGAFFAERLEGTADGILRFDRTGMLVPRPWLSDRPIDWHLFDERYVPPGERYWHALP
jgi:hypothetical protein